MVILRLGFDLRIRGRNSWQLKPVNQSEIRHFERESYAGLKENRMMMALLSKRESEASTLAPESCGARIEILQRLLQREQL